MRTSLLGGSSLAYFDLTTLVVTDAHQRVQHNGVKETLVEVRSKYWIVGGRSLVRSLIHRGLSYADVLKADLFLLL